PPRLPAFPTRRPSDLALLPAPLLILAVCVALFGVAPRLTALVGWALVALTAIVTMFADLLDLPGWLRAVSPLYHLAEVPVEAFRSEEHTSELQSRFDL